MHKVSTRAFYGLMVMDWGAYGKFRPTAAELMPIHRLFILPDAANQPNGTIGFQRIGSKKKTGF
jgi:hypothetical protein